MSRDWTISIPADTAPRDCFDGAVEINPRTHAICIDQFPRGSSNMALQGHAIVRIPFPWSSALAKTLATWLQQPQATELLRAVTAGYSSEVLWSGDPIGNWNETASRAITAIHHGISMLCNAEIET